MKKTGLILLTSLIFCSCTYFNSDKAKNKIENGTKEANNDLNVSYLKDRDSLIHLYQETFKI